VLDSDEKKKSNKRNRLLGRYLYMKVFFIQKCPFLCIS